MNTTQVLEDLDKHASEYNFPVFDNAYVEYAAARLSAFRSETDWLIAFEVLGFSTRENEFVNDLYAFGSCNERQGFVAEETPIHSVPGHPLFDATTNECIADWSNWEIGVGDDKMAFSPKREEYADAGVSIPREAGPKTLSEIDLLRFLIHRLGKERFFMSDPELLSHFPLCKGLKRFVQTTQWEHPDIANEERPSKNLSLRSLVSALSKKDPLLFEQGLSNTHWSYWLPAT
jgi:hypothetical protein